MNRLLHWLRFKRVCCWCQTPHRIGGNPWARRVTHGVCRDAMGRQLAAIGLTVDRRMIEPHDLRD